MPRKNKCFRSEVGFRNLIRKSLATANLRTKIPDSLNTQGPLAELRAAAAVRRDPRPGGFYIITMFR